LILEPTFFCFETSSWRFRLLGFALDSFLGFDLLIQTSNSFASSLALTFDDDYLKFQLSNLLAVSRIRLIEITLSMTLSAMK
jgi:hypothetical protein